jgi:hypothetical protein
LPVIHAQEGRAVRERGDLLLALIDVTRKLRDPCAYRGQAFTHVGRVSGQDCAEQADRGLVLIRMKPEGAANQAATAPRPLAVSSYRGRVLNAA